MQGFWIDKNRSPMEAEQAGNDFSMPNLDVALAIAAKASGLRVIGA